MPALAVLALCGYGVLGAVRDRWFLPLHGVDLLIHEAGHLITGVFGHETVTVLGGTLFQLALPTAFAVYFARRRQGYGLAFALFWVAQNCFDVAVYVRDAPVKVLPLLSIGGDEENTIHDWEYLLNRAHALSHAGDVAYTFVFVGGLLLLATAVVGLWASVVRDTAPPPAPVENFLA